MKIFVTVGTFPYGFNRLFKELDTLVGEKKLKDRIFAQVGSAKVFQPKNFAFQEMLAPEEVEENIKKADLIITHGGIGSIMHALIYRKPLVLVPRLKKFNEAVDDHQLDLCQALENEKKALVAYTMKDLLKTIKKAKTFRFKHHGQEKSLITEIIERAFKEWGFT